MQSSPSRFELMRGLAGKGVLVTGGSRGIGYATVRRFLQEQARVFLCGDDQADVDQALVDLGGLDVAAGMCCDISREEEVATLVIAAAEWLAGIDVLVNNAGIARREPFLEITPASFDRIVEVNLRGTFLVAQAVARHMVDRGRGGAIINMSSTNGLGGEEDYAHYNATKAGVLLLTKTMAVELGKHNIRVNALCPGYIQTPLNATIAADLEDDFVAGYVRTRIPIGRPGTADDVAAAYAFLASDDASFINGAELVIDGGQMSVM
jgi:NAD(P)-dependent dehydrogenase (short-subunit alcohol dehydrogenase family)